MFDGTSATVSEFPAREHIVPRSAPIGTAIVGYGYWGPNLARNVAERPELGLEALCDRDPVQLAAFCNRHPQARAFEELDAVLIRPSRR